MLPGSSQIPMHAPPVRTGGACIAAMDGEKPTLDSERVFPSFPYVLQYFMRVRDSSQENECASLILHIVYCTN